MKDTHTIHHKQYNIFNKVTLYIETVNITDIYLNISRFCAIGHTSS